MHELAMVESLYDIIIDQLTKSGAKKVIRVNLVVGELTGVEDMTMKACFEMYAESTPADGAELVIKRIPVKVSCRVCGNVFETKIPFETCPKCKSRSFKIMTGKELYIESLDVE